MLKRDAVNKKEKIINSLNFAKDAALGVPVITVNGNYEVYVENFRSILCYECGMVKLTTKQGLLTVIGNRLEIDYYNDEEILIKGHINRIEL